MTKRLLALLLALAMVISVLPTGFAADGGTVRSPAPEEASSVPAHDDPEPAEDARSVPAHDDPEPAVVAPSVPAPDDAGTADPGGPVREVQSGNCGDGLTWSFDEATGVLTIEGTGPMYDYSTSDKAPWDSIKSGILSAVVKDGVTSVGDFAFWYCTKMTGLTLPDSLVSIGQYAFYTCSVLEPITFPVNLTEIGADAFSFCSKMTEAELPEGLLTMEEYAFSSSGLKSVSLPSTLRVIGDYAFRNCSKLESVVIPEGVETVGEYAFKECSKLTAATLPSAMDCLGTGAFYDCSLLSSVTMPASLNTLGSYAFYGCRVLSGVILPDNLTAIPAYAFYNCNAISDISFPEGLTSIGSNAFYASSIVSLEIPDSVVTLGTYAFSSNRSMTSLALSANLTTIPASAFSLCENLETVTIPAGVQSIGNKAFQYCHSLTDVSLPEDLASIGSYAFSQCDLRAPTIPASVTSLGGNAFEYNKSLSEVHFLGAPPSYGSNMFYRCADDLILLYNPEHAAEWSPNGETTWTSNKYPIQNVSEIVSGVCGEGLSWAFYPAVGTLAVRGEGPMSDYNDTDNPAPWAALRSQIVSVKLQEGLSGIGACAFCGCTGLTAVTVPASVTALGDSAFSDCPALQEALFQGAPPTTAGEDLFARCGIDFIIYYTSAYASDWAPNGETQWNGWPIWQSGTARPFGRCGENLLWSYNEDTKLLTVTGSGAMFNYDTSSNLPPWNNWKTAMTAAVLDGASSVGSYAFYGCSKLASVSFRSPLELIGADAFRNCSVLTGADLSAGVTTIGSEAFLQCSKLETLVLPEGLQKIGSSAFSNCTALSSVTMPDSLRYVGDYAFRYDSKLTAAVMPASMDYLGCAAFGSCTLLASLTMPETLTTMSSDVFSGCKALTAAVLPAGIGFVPQNTFYGCTGLSSVTIPDSAAWIGQQAFYNCTGLGSVTIPEGVTSLGYAAFYGCSQLSSVILPASLTEIGSYAFYRCTALSGILLPEDLTSIGSNAFAGCTLITSVTIPAGVSSISDYAFDACKLTAVTLPAALTYLGSYAFRSNTGLEDVIFLGAPPQYGTKPFYNCAQYLTLFYTEEHASEWSPNGETTWTSYAYPIQAWCEPVVGTWGEDQTWLYYPNTGALIFRGSGAMDDYDDGGNKAPWAVYRDAITSVQFRGQPSNIGAYAFCGCTALNKAAIPAGVETVGASAFSGCAVLEAVTLPDGLTGIGASAFAGCTTLTELTIPASVEEIGDSVFAGCSGLTAVNFEADPPAVFGETVFAGCFVDFTIYYPEEYASLWDEDGDGFWNDWPVWLFGTPKPFGHCGDNVEWSFEDGVLSVFGEGPTWDYGDPGALNSPPWADTFEVSQLQIYPGVTYLGTCFFAFCGGEGELTIPGTVQAIGYRAFYSDTFSSVVLGEGVKAIGPFAFAWGSIDGGYDGERFAYYHQDSMLSVTLPSTLEYIGTGAFSQCFWLSSPIVIPAGVEVIEPMTFYDCQRIPSITLSEGVTTIGYHAFYDCAALTELTIPASVNSIDATAFHWCFSLGEFHVDAANSAYQAVDGVLFTKDGKTLVRYPNGKGSSYTIPAGTEKIGADAFAYTGEYYFNIDFMDIEPDCIEDHTAIFLDSVSFPSGVTGIEDRAFYDSSITSVALNEGLTRIGKEAFSWSPLRTVEFPASLNYIDDYAFGYCRLLHSIYLHSDTGLGENVFYDCDGDFCALMGYPSAGKGARSEGLTWNGYPALYWPAGDPVYPWHVGPKVFAFIDEENTLILTGEGDMNNYSFSSGGGAPVSKSGSRDGDGPELLWGEDAARIEAIFAREGVIYIGANTCCLLPNLTKVTLPTTLLALGDNAFRQCENLNRVVFEGPLPEYCGDDVFTDCAAELCLWYHVWYADTWAPEGETEWYGWSIRQIEMSDGYYLIGPKGWTAEDVDPEQIFTANPDVSGEYLLSTELSAGDPVKVVKVENGAISAWYPEGEGGEYVTDAAHAGEVIICFRPAGSADWSAFGGFIWIVPVEQPHVHTLVHVPAAAAGCVTEGNVEYWYCSDESCELCGRFFADEALTQELETVTVPALGHNYVDGVCTRCGAADPNYHPMQFTDVPQDAYYYNSVLWALANGVTSGTSETAFSPNRACTRAEIVTFLWRAAGKPAPTSPENPFSDVTEGAWYYTAVLWAAEQGITDGTSDTTFSPYGVCTRAEAVTFLWRASGRPAASQTENPFTDVKEGDWYYEAVLWAVGRGITNGTSASRFSPRSRCTRAQVVTFLWRAAEAG